MPVSSLPSLLAAERWPDVPKLAAELASRTPFPANEITGTILGTIENLMHRPPLVCEEIHRRHIGKAIVARAIAEGEPLAQAAVFVAAEVRKARGW